MKILLDGLGSGFGCLVDGFADPRPGLGRESRGLERGKIDHWTKSRECDRCWTSNL